MDDKSRGYGQGEQGKCMAAPPPPTDEQIEGIAWVCHEANRAYCLSLGDGSQPAWETAPAWQKDSARHGVRKALGQGLGLKLGCLSDNEERHNGWMELKLRAGWTYGPVKDAEKKTHPCLLPYASLPPEERRKDSLFGAICRAVDPQLSV